MSPGTLRPILFELCLTCLIFSPHLRSDIILQVLMFKTIRNDLSSHQFCSIQVFESLTVRASHASRYGDNGILPSYGTAV